MLTSLKTFIIHALIAIGIMSPATTTPATLAPIIEPQAVIETVATTTGQTPPLETTTIKATSRAEEKSPTPTPIPKPAEAQAPSITPSITTNSELPKPLLPDLIVNSVSCAPDSPTINDWLSCDVTIYNDSPIDAKGQIMANAEAVNSVVTDLPAHTKKIIDLPRNSFRPRQVGTNSVIFSVDPNGWINETNENNNTYAKTIIVRSTESPTTQPPSSPVTSAPYVCYDYSNEWKYEIVDLTWDVESVDGKVYGIDNFAVKVKNVGICDSAMSDWTFSIYIDSADGSNLIHNGYMSTEKSILKPGESRTFKTTLTQFPKKMLSGERKIVFTAVMTHVYPPPALPIFEKTISFPVANPVITSISPSETTTSGNGAFTFSGDNFSGIQEVVFVGPDGTIKKFPNLNLSVPYAKTFNFYFGSTWAAMPPGAYKVYVTDGTLQSNSVNLLISDSQKSDM